MDKCLDIKRCLFLSELFCLRSGICALVFAFWYLRFGICALVFALWYLCSGKALSPRRVVLRATHTTFHRYIVWLKCSNRIFSVLGLSR